MNNVNNTRKEIEQSNETLRVTTLVRNMTKKNKRSLSKVKIKLNDISTCEKIVDFFGKDFEFEDDISVAELENILSNEYFSVKIEELTEKDRLIDHRRQLVIDVAKLDKEFRNSARCFELNITDRTGFCLKVCTGLFKIKKHKSSDTFFYKSNPNKTKTLVKDLNIVAGYLKTVSSVYKYYTEISMDNNNLGKFEFVGNYFNQEYYSLDQVNSLIELDKKNRSIGRFNRLTGLLIIDAMSVMQEIKLNIELDDKYNASAKGNYAKSYMTKKNIPEKIMALMKNNAFLKEFNMLELDETVDTTLFKKLEKEYVILKNSLKLDNILEGEIDLRFRLLGQHKAAGIYYPGKCICVDLKYPSSFIHELAHHIDYKFGSYGLKLSNNKNFRELSREYKRLYLDHVDSIEDSGVKKYLLNKKSYYFTPTEIFARCFELYMTSLKSLKSSFAEESFDVGKGYPELTEKFKNLILNYFDNLSKTINLNVHENITTLLPKKDSVDTSKTIKNSNDESFTNNSCEIVLKRNSKGQVSFF